eukprot:1156457-Pelagomonas_calceolata.AAC.2
MFHEVELTRVGTDQLAGAHAKVELASYVQVGPFSFVRRLRLMVRCLVEGFSRLDVSAKASCCCAVPEFVFMFDNPVYHGVQNNEVCWCARSNCKSVVKARDNVCTDDVKRLTWGSMGGSPDDRACF